MSAKIEEAKEHIRAAEKALKTSLMKWSPDYDSAADEYSQAAQCYRIARDPKSSKDCHLKASEFYHKHGSRFHAAKALENAIIVGRDLLTPEELYNLAERSSNLYQQQGSGDSGANVLAKTARILDEQSPEHALKLFQRAADVSATESGQHQAAEYLSKASRILVKLGRYDEAVQSITREIGYQQEYGNTGLVGRLTVCLVLVELARGDSVAAEKAYTEWGNNCEMSEMYTLGQLLTAFNEEDCESAKKALASPFIRSMDIEYARLATTLPLPEAIQPVLKEPVQDNAGNEPAAENAPPYEPTSYPKAAEDDEDELC